MQSNCIFRNLNGCGVRCRNKSTSLKRYCSRHRGNDNYIFEVLDECFPDTSHSLNCADIYTLFAFIQTNDTFEIDEMDGDKTLNNSCFIKRDLFRIIIDYLYSKTKLKKVIHHSYYAKKTYINKSSIIDILYNISYNTFKNSGNVSYICKIQCCFRRFLYKEITKYNNCKSENDTDPFSFDNINDIPSNEKFGFKDAYGRIYIFNTVEFYHFIETNGLWNPYTRDKLPSYIKNYLKLLIKYNGLNEKNKIPQWVTPSHAYTEVSQLLEKVGFYNNVKWFDDLTYVKCNKIIRIYRDLCQKLPESRRFFPTKFELTKDGYIFEFCKEIISMFENADSHYLVCCNFMKAVALNIDKFYQNMPTWLLDIESNLNIEFDANTDLQSDSLLFFYVYNLLDHLPEIN